MNQQTYSQEAIEQIMKRASVIDESQGVLPDQLERVASELGISSEALEMAKAQWLADQTKGHWWTNAMQTAKSLRQHLWIYSFSNVLIGTIMHAWQNPNFWPIPVVWMGIILFHVQRVVTREEQAHLDQPKHEHIAIARPARPSHL